MKLKRNNESGRTMLEILIVVALVGLLSLLPLEIYGYAIDKYRSNILKDEVLQRSADLKHQIDSHKKIFNLDKWEQFSKIGVPINYIENDTLEQNSIGIQVTNVEERICNMMLDGLEKLERIRVNDVLYVADSEPLCRGNDTIVFYFDPLPKRNVKNNLQDHCPSDTPKGADPDTCKCDLTQRYFQESTNECVCWSGEEIDGVCMNVCATSADCDENEICENHICVKYDYTTITEPMNTTEVPETTYTTSTTISETTSTSSTPLSSTTTTSVYETTTSTYITTSQYETTTPETTTLVCPTEKPHYDTDTHTCVECLTDTDCENMAICSSDKTCICQMTGTECLSSEFNPTHCMCCPSEAPIYDSVSGMCKTCDEMHPEWAETGSGYDVTTRQCWAYCGEQKAGVVLLVDRSPSTHKEANKVNGKLLSLHIMDAVRKLKIPDKIKMAIYIHDKMSPHQGQYIFLYGNYSQSYIKSQIEDPLARYIWTVSETSFEKAARHIRNTICRSGDKLLVMMWTDGIITGMSAVELRQMRIDCYNSKFYYIGPKANNNLVYDKFYPIHSLPEEYVDSLNDFIKQEGCIPKK